MWADYSVKDSTAWERTCHPFLYIFMQAISTSRQLHSFDACVFNRRPWKWSASVRKAYPPTPYITTTYQSPKSSTEISLTLPQATWVAQLDLPMVPGTNRLSGTLTLSSLTSTPPMTNEFKLHKTWIWGPRINRDSCWNLRTCREWSLFLFPKAGTYVSNGSLARKSIVCDAVGVDNIYGPFTNHRIDLGLVERCK